MKKCARGPPLMYIRATFNLLVTIVEICAMVLSSGRSPLRSPKRSIAKENIMLFTNEFDQAYALMGFPQDEQTRTLINSNVAIMQERKDFSPMAAIALTSIVDGMTLRNQILEEEDEVLFDDDLIAHMSMMYGLNVKRVLNSYTWHRIEESRSDDMYCEECSSVLEVEIDARRGRMGATTYVVLVERQLREKNSAEIYPLGIQFEPLV